MIPSAACTTISTPTVAVTLLTSGASVSERASSS
jgi:hypothetical protein